MVPLLKNVNLSDIPGLILTQTSSQDIIVASEQDLLLTPVLKGETVMDQFVFPTTSSSPTPHSDKEVQCELTTPQKPVPLTDSVNTQTNFGPSYLTPDHWDYTLNAPEDHQVIRHVVQGVSEGKDEYEVFGEYIAAKVKSLSTQYARATVKHMINNVIYRAELGAFDNPSKK